MKVITVTMLNMLSHSVMKWQRYKGYDRITSYLDRDLIKI